MAGWARRGIEKSFAKTKVDATLARFTANSARWAILVLAVVASLGVFGVHTTSFAAILAAAGLAIGLAFQGSLSNISSGVMLLVFRPFKVGDVISVGGELGKVAEIELFTTKLDTPDNRRVIMPNSAVASATITNFSFHEIRRVDVSVGTFYASNLDSTRRVLERAAAAAAVPGVLIDPPLQVMLMNLGDCSIDWQIRVWSTTADYWAVKDGTTRAAKVALDVEHIGIPFPQMDIHVDPEFVETLSARPKGEAKLHPAVSHS